MRANFKYRAGSVWRDYSKRGQGSKSKPGQRPSMRGWVSSRPPLPLSPTRPKRVGRYQRYCRYCFVANDPLTAIILSDLPPPTVSQLGHFVLSYDQGQHVVNGYFMI
ncbi:hypothetical protein EVAR_75087_1 [Eumeta japonica]|uniref:Uncharacterized protein n=1 Tax=Eumeta variegata TaxID=151549 RepID=A0A4C1W1B0_EUMVA|nr:hypothetical protein EVAR_75087_1 [Eumeta japonica]